MNLKALIEKRAEAKKELRAFSDKITKEERAMSEDERAEFDALVAKVDGLTSTIESLQNARDLSADDGSDAEERSSGKKKETDAEVEAREHRAFANYIRAIVGGNEEQRADANLTYSDSSNAVVPKTIAKKIVAQVYDISPILDKATKYVTKGTLEIPVYGANSGTDITMAYASEFTDLESKIGKFTSVELQGFLAGALVKLSNSLINNTDLDLVNFAVERIAYEVSRFMEGELINGTTGKAEGLSGLQSAQNVETASASVISADDLIDVKNRVKQAFRKNAMWIVSTETLSTIEKLKDGDGRYLFNTDPTGEFDGKLLGYPVYVSDAMAEIADGAVPVVFGDMSGLALKTTEQLEIQVLREKYATQHATGIVAWTEFDSKVENHQKISQLTVKATV